MGGPRAGLGLGWSLDEGAVDVTQRGSDPQLAELRAEVADPERGELTVTQTAPSEDQDGQSPWSGSVRELPDLLLVEEAGLLAFAFRGQARKLDSSCLVVRHSTGPDG